MVVSLTISLDTVYNVAKAAIKLSTCLTVFVLGSNHKKQGKYWDYLEKYMVHTI